MGTGVVFLAALIGYAAYAVRTPGGPRGGTAIGLAFGIAGYAVMLFEGLLGVRPQPPLARRNPDEAGARTEVGAVAIRVAVVAKNCAGIAIGLMTMAIHFVP